MKMLILFVALAQYAAAETIDFNGNTIKIDGSFEQLAVQGTDINGKVSITNLLDGSSSTSSIDHRIESNILYISVKGNNRIKISAPKAINVKINPIQIVYEGSYVHRNDAHNIHVYDTDGEIEINGDGYKVYLARTSGSISVVTFEDIQAILPNLSESSIVSLDSYLGDITFRIPLELEPRVKATAPKGTVNIKGGKELFDNQKNNGNNIILHSEAGKQIFVSSLTYIPEEPLYPELRDELIKMWIEDQGKNRMANGARKELTAMGYGPFIESQDDIYKGHPLTKKHQKQLDKIIAKYGFPTEEMVGFEYALGAVRQVLFQSGREYFDKYKDQAKEVFGEGFISMYNRVH